MYIYIYIYIYICIYTYYWPNLRPSMKMRDFQRIFVHVTSFVCHDSFICVDMQ